MASDSRLLAEVVFDDDPQTLTSFRALPLKDSRAARAYALGPYYKLGDHVLSGAVRASKAQMPSYATRFAKALAIFIANVEPYASADFLLSVPGREGGLDRIGSVVSRLADFDLGDHLEVRGSALRMAAGTPHLRVLGAAGRREAVRDSMSSNYRYGGGCSAILIDDVHTSGATTDEATRVLLASGLDQVWVLVLTKTVNYAGAPDAAREFQCRRMPRRRPVDGASAQTAG